MKVALLCIGDELLKGSTVNTNLAFLGEQLLRIGIIPELSLEIPDRRDSILKALDYAYSKADTVITSGGLGPTSDDITKDSIAEYFHLPLEKNEQVEAHLTAWWQKLHSGPVPFHWNRQAYFPAGANIIPNRFGSAPGIHLEWNGKAIFMLPGPPAELHPMFEEGMLERIRKKRKTPVYASLTHVVGIGESIVEERTQPLLREGISVAYCASPGHVKLFFTSKDELLLNQVTREARELFAGDILSEGVSTLPEEILRLLEKRQFTLATAESCTGGMISAQLTAVPGSSAVFLGGAATYSNRLKQLILGVSETTLAKFGAVSRECAKEMVEGVCSRTGADAGISVTGIAGPSGGTPDKPVGRVYIGVKLHDTTRIFECNFRGGREQVRNQTVARALNELRKLLLQEPEQ